MTPIENKGCGAKSALIENIGLNSGMKGSAYYIGSKCSRVWDNYKCVILTRDNMTHYLCSKFAGSTSRALRKTAPRLRIMAIE